MLTALGKSPGKCGYTGEQVKKALECLPGSGVKQLGSDAAHLYYLLLEQGVIDKDAGIAGMAGPHPQIMKLRFDRERSALNDMPVQLIKQVIPLLLTYADGAVKRQDKKWVDFDPMAELETAGQYPFEVSDADSGPGNSEPGYRWEYYTWKEIEARLAEIDTAIPTGWITPPITSQRFPGDERWLGQFTPRGIPLVVTGQASHRSIHFFSATGGSRL